MSLTSSPATEPHAAFAARAFGICMEPPPKPQPLALPTPGPGETLAIIGPSGAGKTLALNALGGTPLPKLREAELDSPLLALFPSSMPSESVLRSLARAGLADGRLWRMRARQLSAGERQRIRFALALAGGADGLLVADEFDAHLDELTACALAQTLRRLKLCLALSTHNPATLPYLAPDRLFRIDGGLQELTPPAALDLGDELEIVPGRAGDWQRFKQWHYLGPGRPGPSCAVWVARVRGRKAGIVMFGYPHLLLAARREALPARFHAAHVREHGAAALNSEVRLLQRVVVDPRLRGSGIAVRLIEHGLRELGVPYVECIAQMGAFSGFLERAGFRDICALEPSRQARALLRFLKRRDIPTAALQDAPARERLLAALPANDAQALRKHLRALAESRVNTGHGGARQAREIPATALQKALARLGATPRYYLWRGD